MDAAMGLEEGSWLQGIGVSIPQSSGAVFVSAARFICAKAGNVIILASQKVLKMLRELLAGGSVNVRVRKSWEDLPLKCGLSPSWLCSGINAQLNQTLGDHHGAHHPIATPKCAHVSAFTSCFSSRRQIPAGQGHGAG